MIETSIELIVVTGLEAVQVGSARYLNDDLLSAACCVTPPLPLLVVLSFKNLTPEHQMSSEESSVTKCNKKEEV